MNGQIKGTAINNEALFDIWCKMVASDIMACDFVSLESVTNVVKVSILNDLDKFCSCVLFLLNNHIT